MCGFVAYIQQKKDQVPLETLKNCLNQIKHRGPDSSGLNIDNLVGLAHHRLSIFDTSSAGDQPMKRGQQTIVFNGAIYNFKELRAQLSDFQFTSGTDTEVIIAAYQKWGPDCVKKFNGQWSFVIHDKDQNIVFCSRDRYGIKPFYYLETDDCFWISSEIKAFHKTGFRLEENENASIDFLHHGIHNHNEETFFKEVLCLTPGSNLIYDLYDHSYAIKAHYNLNTNIEDQNFQETVYAFKERFYNSLKYRLRSDVPLGVALSGGLDSTSIACGIKNLGSEPCSISAVYKDRDYSEEQTIDITTEFIQLQNHKALVNESLIIDNLDEIIWHHDQPVASMSVAAQFFNFQKAKEKNIKVMLSGQGADETLMGYDAFLKVYLKQINNPIKLLSETVNVALKLPALIRRGSKIKADISKYLKSQSSFVFETYSNTKEQSRDLITRMVLPSLLHYEDRNAMAHGIESRVPYLDHELVDFILSVPEKFLIKKGIRKYLQREGLKEIIPPEVYNDHDKKPFISPQEYWMERNMDFYISKVKALSGYIDHLVDIDNVASMNSRDLFRLLAYASWRKIFFS